MSLFISQSLPTARLRRGRRHCPARIAGQASCTQGPLEPDVGEEHRLSGTDQPRRDVILDVRDLSVSYRATKAVDRVSLHINRGEIFGLLGPNGAGKTSTLSAIEGLLKPGSGTVLVDGVDVHRHPAQAKSKMGVQLQATSFQAQLSYQANRPAVRRALRYRVFRRPDHRRAQHHRTGPRVAQALQAAFWRPTAATFAFHRRHPRPGAAPAGRTDLRP